MSSNSRGYLLVSEQLDDRPDFAADWRGLLCVLLLGYLATVAVHLLCVGSWAGADYQVDGQRLLSTHDAYCWLAGAKGVNSYANFGMAVQKEIAAALAG